MKLLFYHLTWYMSICVAIYTTLFSLVRHIYPVHTVMNYFTIYHFLLLSYIDSDRKITLMQTLLVQDGKLYGQYLFSDVISRALSLPDIIGDKEFQMNEFVVQLSQVRHQETFI
jgi:hypothetical protein